MWSRHIAPVLPKDRRALDANLARRVLFRDHSTRLVNQLHRNVGQGLSHVARAPLAHVRVRQRHTDLGHTVPL